MDGGGIDVMLGGVVPASISMFNARRAYANTSIVNINSDVNGSVGRSGRSKEVDEFLRGLQQANGEPVGGWAGGRSSATAFKAARFNEDDPKYKVRVWMAGGAVTEKDVRVLTVDPRFADEAEMLALTAHIERTGKYDNALYTFSTVRTFDGDSGRIVRDPMEKRDWLDIVDGAMQSRFAEGDMHGFSELKAYWDSLSEAASALEMSGMVLLV